MGVSEQMKVARGLLVGNSVWISFTKCRTVGHDALRAENEMAGIIVSHAYSNNGYPVTYVSKSPLSFVTHNGQTPSGGHGSRSLSVSLFSSNTALD